MTFVAGSRPSRGEAARAEGVPRLRVVAGKDSANRREGSQPLWPVRAVCLVETSKMHRGKEVQLVLGGCRPRVSVAGARRVRGW